MTQPVAELVSLARQGDPEAFAEIYRRYRDSVYNFCLRRLRGHQQTADDAVAETFLSVFDSRLQNFTDGYELLPWLLGVARYKTLDQVRRAAENGHVLLVDDLSTVAPGAPAQDLGGNPGADRAQELLDAASAALDPDDSDLLASYLQVYSGRLTREQLATTMDITPAHLNVRLSRLRQRLTDAVLTISLLGQRRMLCPQLTALAPAGAEVSPLLRKRVTGHARECDICRTNGIRLLDPDKLLIAVPFLAAPLLLARRILGRAGAAAPAAQLAAVTAAFSSGAEPATDLARPPTQATPPGGASVPPVAPPSPVGAGGTSESAGAGRPGVSGAVKIGTAVVTAVAVLIGVLATNQIWPFNPNPDNPRAAAPAPPATLPGSAPSGTAPASPGSPSSSAITPAVPGASALPGVSAPTPVAGTGTGPVPAGPVPAGPVPAGPVMWGYASTREYQYQAAVGETIDLHHDWQWGTWRRSTDSALAARSATTTRTGEGRYQVRIPGVGSPFAVVHVSSGAGWGYPQAISCQAVDARNDGVDEVVDVACHDPAGAAKNLPYQVIVADPSRGAAPMVTARYTPNGGTWTFSATGGPARVRRTAAGRYEVTVAGGFAGSGYAVITPQAAASRCRPTQTARTSGGLLVRIACSTDTAWMFSYAEGSGLSHDPGVPAAYVTVTGGASPGVARGRSWSSNGELPTVTRTGVGTYQVKYQSIGKPQVYPADAVSLTATGSPDRYCRTPVWNSYSTKQIVTILVACFDPAGKPTDADFALGYLRAP
ncbi:RNA polymerase sigma factor (sigma-70 family) [Krasilnikovia cinnamomea]|uniref:RNA polymerase sigma factor (Sigma-70 family) n=1 Tax=Krasilnikovia cinnamomea TaxID=349313 RepID=A0A4Q7ZQC1_9ACTN|nr:RNA polymerase sigma factor [Krasilnikovia cinnamomea]RZU53297.1 RNA polymerase sigma factor (sigma-70 family) [Krasilnikovia cinnamomea]